MNVKRFVGKNAREAMAQVRAAWGDEAVVLSNRPIPGGVEILALPGTAEIPVQSTRTASKAAAPVEPMSTFSFERYVRERQRRQDSQEAGAPMVASPADTPQVQPAAQPDTIAALRQAGKRIPSSPAAEASVPAAPAGRIPPQEPGRFAASELGEALGEEAVAAARQGVPALPVAPAPRSGAAAYADTRDTSADANELLMSELRAMRGMISSQLSSLSWFDSVRRHPVQTQLLRLMISNGFSPALARQIVHRLPEGLDELHASQWLLDVLSQNLSCAGEDAIAQHGGVYALVGPTGVGKTTTTAKIAANFALRHGAASVGLITVDTYRMAASDQLRAFGRLLNIPVHTARDAASLQDLLQLFEKKKLVLIDTVGVGQRDRRIKELFDAIPADKVQRLLVLNASAQAETLEETVQAYGAEAGTRCLISKLDEAVKCGAVVDVAIRRKLRVEGIANGQRVPEDWHAARAQLLVQKALMKQPSSIFTPDDGELGLLLTAPPLAPLGPMSRGLSAEGPHA